MEEVEKQRHGLDDQFLRNYEPSDLRIASEFFANWLPFLSTGLCPHCTRILSHRIRSIDPDVVDPNGDARGEHLDENSNVSDANNVQSNGTTSDNHDDNRYAHSFGSCEDEALENPSGEASQPVPETCDSRSIETPSPRMRWAEMAQEDEFSEEERESSNNAAASAVSNPSTKALEKPQLPREKREYIRFTGVRRKEDFLCFERVKGKLVNIVEGLELHTGVFSAAEQKRIVNYVFELQEMGIEGQLKERTYLAPQKWMRGKGRQTIQFGCCYSYAKDRDGNPPGILHSSMVDPIPDLFKVIIRRLVRWHVLPPTCVPDSCIVDFYEKGDCIPPHIDNHDFVRPFCTVSFLSECNMVFGSNLKVIGAGEFDGSFAIPLPVGSVLVLNGNGADVAKHCVPAVPKKRISITFRRMDVSKRPIGYVPEPDLQGIQPLFYEVEEEKRSNEPRHNRYMKRQKDRSGGRIDAMGYANRRDRFLEPHELTPSPRRPANRQSWVKRNS